MTHHLLFLCVANSARSQMGEGLARAIFGPNSTIQSAGSKPSFVHPLALQALDEWGIDISKHQSKSVQDIDLKGIDLMITLCAEEICPVVPSNVQHLHWPLRDPAAPAADEQAQMDQFRQIRDELAQRLRELKQALET